MLDTECTILSYSICIVCGVLAVALVLHFASRSFDGEAVGVSEVVEGGSAFEYNKACLKEEFVGSWWL